MNTLSTFYNNSKTLTVDNTEEDEPDLSHSIFNSLIFNLSFKVLSFVFQSLHIFPLNEILLIKLSKRVKGW